MRDRFIDYLKSKGFQACLSACQVVLERRLKDSAVDHSLPKDVQEVCSAFVHFPHHTIGAHQISLQVSKTF